MRQIYLTPEDSQNLAALRRHFEERVVVQLGNQWKFRNPNLDSAGPTPTQRTFGTLCMLIAAFVLFVWPPTATTPWFTLFVLVGITLVLLLKMLSEVSEIHLWQRTARYPYQMQPFPYERRHVYLLLSPKTPVDAWFVSLVILIVACFLTCWPLFLAMIGVCYLTHLRKRYATYAYKHALVVLAVQ